MKKFSQVFEEAKELVEAGRWIKGNDVAIVEGQLCFCVRGAIKYAEHDGRNLVDYGNGDVDFSYTHYDALDYAYNNLEGLVPDHRAGIAGYNDAFWRSSDDIVALLDGLRDRALAEGV